MLNDMLIGSMKDVWTCMLLRTLQRVTFTLCSLLFAVEICLTAGMRKMLTQALKCEGCVIGLCGPNGQVTSGILTCTS